MNLNYKIIQVFCFVWTREIDANEMCVYSDVYYIVTDYIVIHNEHWLHFM